MPRPPQSPKGTREPYFPSDDPSQRFREAALGAVRPRYLQPVPEVESWRPPCVACAVLELRDEAALQYDEVRVSVPAWRSEDTLLKDSEQTGVVRYWYSSDVVRPAAGETEAEVFGYRDGVRHLLWKGSIRVRGDASR